MDADASEFEGGFERHGRQEENAICIVSDQEKKFAISGCYRRGGEE